MPLTLAMYRKFLRYDTQVDVKTNKLREEECPTFLRFLEGSEPEMFNMKRKFFSDKDRMKREYLSFLQQSRPGITKLIGWQGQLVDNWYKMETNGWSRCQ